MSRELDTEPGGLDVRGTRRKYFQFDPTFNTGHAVQIVVLCIGGIGAYASLAADRAKQQMEVDQIKKDASAEVARSEKAVGELKGDVREVQKSITEVNLKLERISTQLGNKEKP